MKPTLLEIIASTRPGRAGLPVGRWFEQVAHQQGAFNVQVADLLEIDLPMMNEPNHPRFRNYHHEHTKRWSRQVDQADAVVLVMPEYNFAMTAPLKNALDYLYWEWQYKPVGLVSYGGVSGGLRAQQMVKQVVTTLKMMPLTESVTVPFVAQHIQNGEFQPPPIMTESALQMLQELVRWEEALRPLRESARVTGAS
jgi:NAD(P)H-dependent FMN reductase